MEKFSRKMKRSGHKEKMRREVLDAGVKIHAEQVEKDEAGEKVMFRTRKEAKEEKKKIGGNKQRDWYKKKGGAKKERVEAVMMVPYTPESQLLRKFKEITQRNKINIKFVEKGGYSVQNIFWRKVTHLGRRLVGGRGVSRVLLEEGRTANVMKKEERMKLFVRNVRR